MNPSDGASRGEQEQDCHQCGWEMVQACIPEEWTKLCDDHQAAHHGSSKRPQERWSKKYNSVELKEPMYKKHRRTNCTGTGWVDNSGTRDKWRIEHGLGRATHG